MRPLRVLVADDEPLARETLRGLLVLEDDVDLGWEVADGDSAVNVIRSEAPDIAFLDVEMPGLDGFGVVREVGPEAMPTTVFVTAYDQYAVKAFDVSAVDYLLKPFDDDRFRKALDRARSDARRRAASPDLALAERLHALLAARVEVEPEEPVLDRILVRDGARLSVVRAEAVDWVESQGDYMALHVGPRTHLVRETMKVLSNQLGDRFVRVHRSALVNIDRVRELRPTSSGDCLVRMLDGTDVRASRRYWKVLADRFGGAR